MGEAAFSRRWATKTGASPAIDGTWAKWAFSPNSHVRREDKLLKANATRGTRAQGVWQTREAPYDVLGSLTINPSPAFLGEFLVYAMGGGTATAPAFADILPWWSIQQDEGTANSGNGDCFRYTSMKVNRFTMRGRATGLVECTIDVIGKTQLAAQVFNSAAAGVTIAYEPYAHSDLTFTFDGGDVRIKDWEFTIDNRLTADFANSLTAEDIFEGNDRVCTFNATAKLGSSTYDDLYNNTLKNGAAATLLLSNSTVSTSLAFSALQLPKQTPNADGTEIILPLRGEIRATTAAGAELTVTNDITP